MIMRITAKLGKKIGHTPSQVLPLAANPFTDWTANVFFAERTQYIIITNTATLYSGVMYGKGVTDNSIFLQRVMNTLFDTLHSDGFGFIFERLIAPDASKVFFSKSLSRAVTGSMNDLIFQARCCLVDADLSPFDLSFRLNETPLSYIGHDSPREAFHKLKIA